jgi:hypothetical protein
MTKYWNMTFGFGLNYSPLKALTPCGPQKL